jgi:hypothetical protein
MGKLHSLVNSVCLFNVKSPSVAILTSYLNLALYVSILIEVDVLRTSRTLQSFTNINGS